ncbi:hypothetical protein TASIC1_0002024600 [Trichoderma asperellum]|uniref:Uncharacterized protein n=1 Tax=Trichoderma asperellum TaxID=101201 RepID=A0A6V8QLM6_TRIAP|nr:hypothetical protein LI328DRAFT_138708 [Trichoderma asperelloides]GFP53062.1 hypothetical protein TASIC1_0002024600 [Trichoderma asperellum]
MASYDDDLHRQQYHPSNSIPDAAYPDDSPFRLQLQSTYVGGGFPTGPSHPMPGFTPLGPHVGNQPGYQPQHQVQPQQQGTWQPYDIPSSPPPPYDPSQAPSAYPYPQNDATTTAAQTINPHARADVHAQTGGIEMMPLQTVPTATATAPTHMAPLAPGASTSALTQASHAAEDPYKLDAAAMERRRKQRRLRICIIVMAVVFFFCGALIIGLALGVVKGALNHPPPNHGNNNF